MWSGFNAANIASQMQIDYLIGTVNDEYALVVEGRQPYITDEDVHTLEFDCTLSSVFDVFRVQLRLNRDDLLSMTQADLEQHIAAQSMELRDALSTYGQLLS